MNFRTAIHALLVVSVLASAETPAHATENACVQRLGSIIEVRFDSISGEALAFPWEKLTGKTVRVILPNGTVIAPQQLVRASKCSRDVQTSALELAELSRTDQGIVEAGQWLAKTSSGHTYYSAPFWSGSESTLSSRQAFDSLRDLLQNGTGWQARITELIFLHTHPGIHPLSPADMDFLASARALIPLSSASITLYAVPASAPTGVLFKATRP